MDAKFEIKESKIHGVGLFSKKEINQGEILFLGVEFKNKRLILNKKYSPYVNHSNEANCIFSKEFDKFYIKSIKKIKVGDEILVDYNSDTTPHFINKYNK